MKKRTVINFMGETHELEYDQGENPPLTEPEKKQIREHAAKIHNGSKIQRCSVCGCGINAPQGTCAPCESCGSSFNCGGV